MRRKHARRMVATKFESSGWVAWANSHRRDYVFLVDCGLAERADLVKARLPASVLVALAGDMHIPWKDLLDWLGISRAAVNRRARTNGLLGLGDSDRTLGAARIIGHVAKIVTTAAGAEAIDVAVWTAAWLQLPNPAIRWRPPLDYLDTADGRELIVDLVASLRQT